MPPRVGPNLSQGVAASEDPVVCAWSGDAVCDQWVYTYDVAGRCVSVQHQPRTASTPIRGVEPS
jgi:uncharacterized membrane-anchored protein